MVLPLGILSPVVNAAAFGMVGDDSTDNTPAFLMLRDYLRGHSGSIVYFPPGTYRYRNNLWLKGVESVTIIGYGAKFRNTFPWTYDIDSATINLNPDYFSRVGDEPISPGSPTPTPVTSYRLNTSTGYTNNVYLTNPADTQYFRFPESVLIYGYSQQNGGYPPNARYHEIRRIVAAPDPTTGLLVLDEPLRNFYDSRWYGIPAQILILGAGYYRLAEHIHIEGIECLDHPNQPTPNLAGGNGQVYASGARSVTLVNCKVGLMTPTQVQRFRAYGCTFNYVEVDKFIEKATFENCRINSLVGATGCDEVVLRDCDIYEQLAIWPRHFYGQNLNIHATDVNGVGKATVNGDSVVYDTVRFHRRPGETSNLILAGDQVRSVTVLATPAPTPTSIAVNIVNPVDLEPLPYLSFGSLLYLGALTGSSPSGTANRGVVTNIYQASPGQGLIIEADFEFTPVAGDVFFYSPTHQLVLHNAFDVNTNEVSRPVQGSFESRPQFYRNNVENSRHKKIVLPLPMDAGFQSVELNGYLEKVTIHVARSAFRAAGDCNLSLFSSEGPFTAYSVDVKQLGTREMFISDPPNQTLGDGLSQTGFRYWQRLNYTYDNTPDSYPAGVMVFEVIDHM